MFVKGCKVGVVFKKKFNHPRVPIGKDHNVNNYTRQMGIGDCSEKENHFQPLDVKSSINYMLDIKQVQLDYSNSNNTTSIYTLYLCLSGV